MNEMHKDRCVPDFATSLRRPYEILAWSITVLLISLAPPCGMLLSADRAAAQEPDPVPIQRIQVPAERAIAEMDRVRRNLLTEMPRAQFEQLVQQAARAEAAGKSPPRMADAAYHATYSEAGLAGTAHWKVTHDADGPGRLPLTTTQLVIRAARWSNRAPVVLGLLDDRPGAGMELLVEGKGERTLSLDWSARGSPEIGAVRFEMRLPGCAVTVFDLDLPSDHSPQVDRDEAVLSGPFAADQPNRRRWRLSFSRPATAGLTVRLSILTPPAANQPPPLLRTFVQTTQKLTPGQLECEFQLDVQVQRGAVRQLNLDLSPDLRVLDIEAPDMQSWAASTVAGVNRVEIHWGEPFRGGRLTLRALAALPPPTQPWTSPGIHVAGALSRGEKLTLLVHPDLELEEWKPGGFQYVAGPGASAKLRVMTLQLRDVGPDVGKRPEAHVRVAAGTFQTRETWVWRLDAEQSSLTVDVQIIARRGPVFQFAWRMPAGWDVEQVESATPNTDLRWNVLPTVGVRPAMLIIDPGNQSSLATEESDRRLTIRLRGPAIAWTGSPDGPIATLAVPQFRPDLDIGREGTLTVRLGVALVQMPTGGRSLRSDQSLAFRGAPDGTIQLRPRRGRLQSRCDAELMIGSDRRKAIYKLQLTPATSAAEELLLFVSAPVSFDTWRTLKGAVDVRSIEQLVSRELSEAVAPLGSLQGWDFLGRSAVARRVAGSWWRLMLNRRLQGPATIELSATLPANTERVEVPLLAVVGTDAFEGRVVVRSVPGWAFRPKAIRAFDDRVIDDHDGWVRRAFRYGAPPFALELVQSSQPVSGQAARVDQAILVRQPTDDGRMLHRFRFCLCGWPDRELPIKLPKDAEIVTIRIDGSEATAANLHGREDSLVLSWNPAIRSSFVDIVYVVPRKPISAFDRLESTEPVLLVAMDLRRIWRLAAGIVPISLKGIRRLPGGFTFGDVIASRAQSKPLASNDPKLQQLNDAARRVPPQPSETVVQWLIRLEADPKSGLGPIVLDSSALTEEGVAPSQVTSAITSAEGSIWSQIRVVPLAFGSNMLLTTPRQAERWGGSAPAEVGRAVESAVRFGHDESGRFCNLLDWLDRSGLAPVGWTVEDGTDWSDWEFSPGVASSEIFVARYWGLALVGLSAGLAPLLLAAAARGGRRLVATIELLAVGLGLVWLPSVLWLLLVAAFAIGLMLAAVEVVELIRHRALEPGATTEAKRSRVAVASLVICIAAVVPGLAGPTEPTPVYLIPGSAPGTQTALVPPDLIETLRALGRQGQPWDPLESTCRHASLSIL